MVKGHWCKHTVAKCANYGGPHFGQARVYPKKKAVAVRRGGGGLLQPGGDSGAPDAAEPQVTAEGERVEGGAEEEIRHESSSREEMQE